MDAVPYLAALSALAALGLAGFYYTTVKEAPPGNDRMVFLMTEIQKGARAFLQKEYTWVSAFALAMMILLAIVIAPLAAVSYVMGAVLSATAGYAGMTVATMANADPGGRRINQRLESWVSARPGRAVLVSSLGQERYLAALREAQAVVGNSSSGVIEAPALGTPTLNVGTRQAGRLRARSVLDCAPTPDAVRSALDVTLAEGGRDALVDPEPPYGKATRCSRVILDRILASTPSDLLLKHFQDLPAAAEAVR